MGMKHIKKAVMPTIVVTMIFFLNYFCFGMENTIIGPFLTLSYLKFRNMEQYYSCMLRSFGIYSVMAVLAWAALLHPLLLVLVNAAALFWIGYFLIDEYNPLNYFPAGMALIFFQISPAEGLRVPVRILALGVSFFLVFLFLEAAGRFQKGHQSKMEELTAEGLADCHRLTDCLKRREWEEADALRNELCQKNRSISLLLYEKNRSAIGGRVKENSCCRYIACFQMIGYLADCVLEGEAGGGTVQLQQMEQLLQELERIDTKENEMESGKKFRFRENPMDLRSFRLRFALRQVIVMTPCLAYGCFCPWKNGYWLAISVFFMMIPIYEHTLTRVTQRVLGSLAGIGICLAAFFMFRGFWARVFLMTAANFFIYCSGSYTSMVACITCSALALNFGTDSYVVMLAQRLIYTLIGAAVAVFANLFIFRIRAFRQCQYVMELLDGLKEKMERASRPGQEERRHLMGQYVVKSYLLSSRLQEFNEIATEEQKRKDVASFLKRHMLFTARLALKNYLSDQTESGGVWK